MYRAGATACARASSRLPLALCHRCTDATSVGKCSSGDNTSRGAGLPIFTPCLSHAAIPMNPDRRIVKSGCAVLTALCICSALVSMLRALTGHKMGLHHDEVHSTRGARLNLNIAVKWVTAHQARAWLDLWSSRRTAAPSGAAVWWPRCPPRWRPSFSLLGGSPGDSRTLERPCPLCCGSV